MESQEIRDEMVELREQIAKSRSWPGGRIEESVRHRVVDYVRQARSQGMSRQQCCQSLGIALCSYYKWQQAWRKDKASKPKASGGFVPVQVKEVEETVARTRGLTLWGPGGTVLEGLDVQDVVSLWKALGSDASVTSNHREGR